MLGIAVKHPPCFVLVEGVVSMEFGFENALPGDDSCTGRSMNEGPCAISLKGVKLLLHCGPPVGVLKCSADGCRCGRQGRG
jgi:hypothetical protein